MSVSFSLTLDTQAPDVVFGEWAHPPARSWLVIPYTADEPGIIAASLQDAEGVLWPFTIYANRIEIFIDDAIAKGTGSILVLTRDSTLNETTYTATIDVLSDYIHVEPPLAGTVFASSLAGVVPSLASIGIELASRVEGSIFDAHTGGDLLVYVATGDVVPGDADGTVI